MDRQLFIECVLDQYSGALTHFLRSTPPDFSNRSRSNLEFIASQSATALGSFGVEAHRAAHGCRSAPAPLFDPDDLLGVAVVAWIHVPDLSTESLRRLVLDHLGNVGGRALRLDADGAWSVEVVSQGPAYAVSGRLEIP